MVISQTVVGVDACAGGWFATIILGNPVQTKFVENFHEIIDEYTDADRILVDVPIGLPTDSRRRCDERASDLLGCRGSSVFYPPCEAAIEIDDYDVAKAEHEDKIGHGLTKQAHSIQTNIREVDNLVPDDRYDGQIRESHPELCFYALNRQPIAYSKSSDRGREMRLDLLQGEIDNTRAIYDEVRNRHPLRTVGRDDIIDSMALAVAARRDSLETVPEAPEAEQPRIYYPTLH